MTGGTLRDSHFFMALGPNPFRLPDPASSIHRYTNAPLWSTFYLSPGKYKWIKLFCVPMGTPGQGKVHPLSHADTNMREGGRLPVGTAYDVHVIQWEVWGKDDMDVEVLCMEGVLAWDFIQQLIDVGPLSTFFYGPHPRQAGELGQTLQALAEADKPKGGMDDLGQWTIYRGSIPMGAHPISLPGGSTWGMGVSFSEEVEIESDCKIRVLLYGVSKSVIVMG